MKRILIRTLVFIVIALLVLAAGVSGWLYWRAHACLPPLEGSLSLPGLAAPVEVLRDAHGVPHLRAHSLDDLFYAQGYITAQDRLWQMDLSRRSAAGELAEVFGERALRFDIDNRTLGLRRICARALADIAPEDRKLLEAYTRGVNAFISAHLDRLPVEFLMLRYRPQPWQPVDCFLGAMNLTKILNTSWPDDLMRERIRAKLTPELYADLFPDHSPLDHPVAVSGPVGKPTAETADPNALTESVLAALGHWNDARPAEPDQKFLSADVHLPRLGSNNWVLSGAQTQSGKPLLANDPHLPHSIPSVWYMIHLKAPGLNVSGVSLPGLPAVIIGHNKRIAWGVTNTYPDVQDLYVESFNFRNPNRYLYNGQWIEDEERDEVIRVRNKRDYTLHVKTTRHGPVVSEDGGRALALRWVALEPHALRYPFLKINQAGNWEEFEAALSEFTGPMQNFVYADGDGNIGFLAAGWVPIRRKGDGSVPRPGSTDEYGWTGYIPFDQLPQSFNPPEGILATANGRIVPDDYPYFLTHQWDAPYRTARIYELLQAGANFSPNDMLRIQTDIRSLEDLWLKEQLLAAAAVHPPRSGDAEYALHLLRQWDGEARADSGATLVCEVARRALLERIVKPRLGDDLSGYHWPMSPTFLENVLRERPGRWLPPGDADFEATLTASLEEGIRRIPGLVGSSRRNAWKWGDAIPLIFHHPLGGGLPLADRLFNVGPFPQAGTPTTVKQTTRSVGPSMRMVVDFSNFDKSMQNITLGQSGQAFSPYYRDQFEAWYGGRSFPMLFSDAAVDAGTVHRLILEPAGR
jgi:penicillin amidase